MLSSPTVDGGRAAPDVVVRIADDAVRRTALARPHADRIVVVCGGHTAVSTGNRSETGELVSGSARACQRYRRRGLVRLGYGRRPVIVVNRDTRRPCCSGSNIGARPGRVGIRSPAPAAGPDCCCCGAISHWARVGDRCHVDDLRLAATAPVLPGDSGDDNGQRGRPGFDAVNDLHRQAGVCFGRRVDVVNGEPAAVIWAQPDAYVD